MCIVTISYIPSYPSPAVQCPPVPYVGKATPSILDTALGSHVQFGCHVGYEYPTGLTSRSIVCFDNQTWSISPPDCQRTKIPISPTSRPTIDTN